MQSARASNKEEALQDEIKTLRVQNAQVGCLSSLLYCSSCSRVLKQVCGTQQSPSGLQQQGMAGDSRQLDLETDGPSLPTYGLLWNAAVCHDKHISTSMAVLLRPGTL